MTKRDPAILRAERLRIIMNMPEYTDTVGAWIEEAHREALHKMTTAKEPHEFHSAQGAYNTMETLRERFNAVFQCERAALTKNEKRLARQRDSDDHTN